MVARSVLFGVGMMSKSLWGVVLSAVLLGGAVGCSDAGGVDDPANEETPSSEALTGDYAVGTELLTTSDVNLRTGPGTQHSIIDVIPSGTRVLSASAKPRNGWYGVTTASGTGWMHGNYLTRSGSGGSTGNSGSWSISAKGRQQMEAVVLFGDANNSGVSAGRCFEYVWNYLWKSGYGKIDSYNDAPDMPSTYARNFAEYMNAGSNAATWGLQRLPINNPYDAPRGAIVVVAPGTPGTAHPTAGDITIAAGNGRFINDGPYMGYGGSRQAFINGGGKVLGIYAPFLGAPASTPRPAPGGQLAPGGGWSCDATFGRV